MNMPMNRKNRLFAPTGLPRVCAKASPEMDDPQLIKWKAQLHEAKTKLAQLGPMRPGSLSQQYRDSATKAGAFWQLS